MPYHSQFSEDRWINENLKPGLGVFCEVGAYDGIDSSNTQFFEQDGGWSGLCIEPVPMWAARCRDNRKCLTWCCAVGPRALVAQFKNPYEHPRPVVVLPLEEIVRASGFDHLDLLSIDTEGTEMEVWETRGALRPGIVILEYLSADQVNRHNNICTRMAADGYKAVRCTEANLIFTLADAP